MASGLTSPTDGSGHVALLCVGTAGHWIPLLHLGDELLKRGHMVTLITSAYAVPKVESYIRDNLIHGSGGSMGNAVIAVVGLEDGIEGQHAFQNLRDQHEVIGFKHVAEMMQESMLAAFKQLSPPAQGAVVDFATYAGLETCWETRTPYALQLPGPLQAMCLFGGLPCRTMKERFYRIILQIAPSVRRFFGPFRHYIPKGYRGCSLLISTSFEAVEEVGKQPEKVILAGPLAQRDRPGAVQPADLATFLEESSVPVVYVSSGSQHSHNPSALRKLFEGFSVGVDQGEWRIIWALKQAEKDCLEAGSLPRPGFYASDWLPQRAIIAHEKVKAVVYHMGWNGTLEILEFGKPVLAAPICADQPNNSELLKARGMAEVLNSFQGDFGPHRPENFTAQEITMHLRNLITKPSYKMCAQKLADELAKSGGVLAAVRAIEERVLVSSFPVLGQGSLQEENVRSRL